MSFFNFIQKSGGIKAVNVALFNAFIELQSGAKTFEMKGQSGELWKKWLDEKKINYTYKIVKERGGVDRHSIKIE